MKNILFILFISATLEICSAQTNMSTCGVFSEKSTCKTAGTMLVDFYCKYSSFTDPGEYEYLYENLPDPLSELCSLIKSQFIHPYAELPKYRELIPKERWDEFFKYPTVKSILEGLLSYDSAGLVNNRKPENKLVLGCREYSILLASILKYRGIPTRVRCGHATYLIPNFHTSHVICEVWNEDEKRWMLVDPGTSMIDFPRGKFDFSNELWLEMQKGEIDPNLCGIPGKYTGVVSVAAKVFSDLASVLGTEHTIFQYPPILDYAFENDYQLADEHKEILDKISELMKSIDTGNFPKLQEMYMNTPEIQITRSFESASISSKNSKQLKNN